MSENNAIETTLRILERSKSPAAQVALLHALNVDDPQIRDSAAKALLRSGSALAKTEVIRNISRFSDDLVEEVTAAEKEMSFPLRQCMQHGDEDSALKALETIETAHLYSEISFLLSYLDRSQGILAERAQHTFLNLVDHLYQERTKLRPTDPSGLFQKCEEIVQTIGAELSRFDKLKFPHIVLESILILGGPEHGVTRRMIRETSTECQAVAWEVLLNSRHPGILSFLIDSLAIKYLHPRILDIISRRRDIEFQLSLVKNIPQNLSVNQERNFCQLNYLPWLICGADLWTRFPAPWQANIIHLVHAMSLKHDEKQAFYESALAHGSVEARVAACKYRHLIKPQIFEQYVLAAIDSEDPKIEAWAVSELNHTELPDKYRYLVNRLDSPSDVVRYQAREALGRFNVQSAIIFSESARPSIGPKLAELLFKVNPEAHIDMAREMAQPVRTRRLRAAKAAAFMQIQDKVQDSLLEMAYDSDSIVRRVVAEILGTINSSKAEAALSSLLEDSSPRVREAATKSIEMQSRYLAGESSTTYTHTAADIHIPEDHITEE